MILLTGASGTVGTALLRRLIAAGTPMRCLVRDPKRLGPERVRVQLALGDLADPGSFRNALRGVDTVIHLGASIRDQPRGSLEELNAMATLRLVRAAERAGARRFVFFSAMGASLQSPTRFFRAKALARGAVENSDLETTVFAPSIVYTPGDPWLTLLERMSHLPAVPVAGSRAVALPADLGRGRGRLRDGGPRAAAGPARRTAAAASTSPVRSRSPTTRSSGRPCVPSDATGRWCTCRCRSCARPARLERGRRPRRSSPPRRRRDLMEEPMTTARGQHRRRGARCHPAADERGARRDLGTTEGPAEAEPSEVHP